jgi:hypothetical protein
MIEKPEWWKSLDPEIKRALRTLSTIAKVDKYGMNPDDKSTNWMKDKYGKFGRKASDNGE